VTIEYPGAGTYEGDVISRSEACVRKRKVQFWFDNDGTPDDLITTVTANRQGHWRFQFVGEAYYARVLRVVKTPGDHRHVCKADQSPSIGPTTKWRAVDKVRTRVAITGDDNDFRPVAARRNYTFDMFGTVRSAKAKCERGRIVRLIDRNVEGKSPPAVAGTAVTEPTGSWRIELNLKPQADAYVAKVRAKRVGGDKCLAAQSKPYFYVPF
jgi:hypothetical protein